MIGRERLKIKLGKKVINPQNLINDIESEKTFAKLVSKGKNVYKLTGDDQIHVSTIFESKIEELLPETIRKAKSLVELEVIQRQYALYQSKLSKYSQEQVKLGFALRTLDIQKIIPRKWK